MTGRVPHRSATTYWSPQRDIPPLPAEAVQVWHLELRVPAGREREWLSWLDPAERARHGRFHFPDLATRHLAAQAQLRWLLGACLGRDPASLPLHRTSRGKPYLPGHPVHFNLSHSDGHGLVALTRRGPVGVDLECLDRDVEAQGIADRFFSAAEAAALAALPEDQRLAGFFRLWTCKEAWLKATGQGISDGLNQVEFNCDPAVPARMLRLRGDPGAAADWQLLALRPHPRFLGALALGAGAVTVSTWHLAMASAAE